MPRRRGPLASQGSSKSYAARWKVSQAEVVRRSLEQVERLNEEFPSDAVAQLQRLHQSCRGLDADVARRYLRDAHEDRERWRSE